MFSICWRNHRSFDQKTLSNWQPPICHLMTIESNPLWIIHEHLIWPICSIDEHLRWKTLHWNHLAQSTPNNAILSTVFFQFWDIAEVRIIHKMTWLEQKRNLKYLSILLYFWLCSGTECSIRRFLQKNQQLTQNSTNFLPFWKESPFGAKTTVILSLQKTHLPINCILLLSFWLSQSDSLYLKNNIYFGKQPSFPSFSDFFSIE